MKQILKDLLIYSLVFALVVLGVWFVRDIEEDKLTHALNQMGDRLISMIENPDDQEKLRLAYADFMDSVFEEEMAPEDVEKVAANILNLSNKNVALTSEQAKALLAHPGIAVVNFIEEDMETLEAASSEETEKVIRKLEDDFHRMEYETEHIQPSERRKKRQFSRSWASVGDQLSTIFTYNDQLKKLALQAHDSLTQFHYIIEQDNEKGLQIFADAALQFSIMVQPEQMGIPPLPEVAEIQWKKDFQHEMRKEQHRLKSELRSLARLKALSGMDSVTINLKKLKIENLTALKQLEVMAMFGRLDSMHVPPSPAFERPPRQRVFASPKN